MESAVEAVIISGPRRGEIIRLPNEAVGEVADEDIQALNVALDGLIVAIDRVATEVRTTIEALRERVGESWQG
jgi:hypothetical protein